MKIEQAEKGDPNNPKHICAPVSGALGQLKVAMDETVKAGGLVAIIEAMKMQTLITASIEGKVARVLVKPGDTLERGDLLVELG